MKILEYIQMSKGDVEFTIVDNEYECEFYISNRFEDDNKWDVALKKIMSVLDVKGISRNDTIITNMTEYIVKLKQNYRDELQELFISLGLADIVCDMTNIMAGYVSEEWLEKFANLMVKVVD